LGGIGPVNLNNDMTLSPNPSRFTTTANLMFIDLLGSGFSFAANTSDLPTEAKTFGVQLTKAINTFAS
jgi:carboxypeptidase C (cathepsin A)